MLLIVVAGNVWTNSETLCITLGKYYWAFAVEENENVKLKYKKYSFRKKCRSH